MALSTQQFELLARKVKPKRRDFGAAFLDLVGRQLRAIDARMVKDVDAMGPFQALRPLPDGDRVILRNRVIWLIASADAVSGTLTVGRTWDLSPTMRALEVFDGNDVRCKSLDGVARPESEMKLLDALAEYYADLVVVERLGPGIARWIEGTTAAMLGALSVPRDREFSAVRVIVKKIAHEEAHAQLVALGQLDTSPVEIRKSPFTQFQA